ECAFGILTSAARHNVRYLKTHAGCFGSPQSFLDCLDGRLVTIARMGSVETVGFGDDTAQTCHLFLGCPALGSVFEAGRVAVSTLLQAFAQEPLHLLKFVRARRPLLEAYCRKTQL